MQARLLMLGICVLLAVVSGCAIDRSADDSRHCWAMHDINRPQPKVVTPGTAGTQQQPGCPPGDAIILFDGKDLSQWVSDKDGGPAKWKVQNGFIEAVKKTGYIRTKRSFGDCQLHIEWATPEKIVKSGQSRGNSGVFMMGRYEVQVLDSYNNKTYPDGQAASIYGQYPPLVNASRKPGQWQSFDIIFHRPRFDKKGNLVCPARITVLHNGLLVQDNVEIKGATAHKKKPVYNPHSDKLPLKLQEHGSPIRYRNIWIRRLSQPQQPFTCPAHLKKLKSS